MAVDLTRLHSVLDGDIVTPSSAAFHRLAAPQRPLRSPATPAAIIRCASEADVARAVGACRASGEPFAVRSGGHCFIGRSTSAGVVIDVSRMNSISAAGGSRVSVAAGVRLEALYEFLDRGHRALPAGCGPTVGALGLALGGGIGLLGRQWGLTCDQMISARVVLADGTIVDCDVDRESDLFWAIRGSGGCQFGVVTEATFAVVDTPRPTKIVAEWPITAAAQLIRAWQRIAIDLPDEVTLNLALRYANDGIGSAELFGAALFSSRAGREAVDEFARRVGPPVVVRMTEHDSVGALKGSFSSATRDQPPADDPTSRSEFFTDDLPDATVDALAVLAADTARPRELNFTAMGGAYDAPSSTETAVAFRGQRFLLEHVSDADDPWLDQSWELAHPCAAGLVYPNFPDLRLADPLTAYHGRNLSRLKRVKQAFDPDGIFASTHGID